MAIRPLAHCVALTVFHFWHASTIAGGTSNLPIQVSLFCSTARLCSRPPFVRSPFLSISHSANNGSAGNRSTDFPRNAIFTLARTFFRTDQTATGISSESIPLALFGRSQLCLAKRGFLFRSAWLCHLTLLSASGLFALFATCQISHTSTQRPIGGTAQNSSTGSRYCDSSAKFVSSSSSLIYGICSMAASRSPQSCPGTTDDKSCPCDSATTTFKRWLFLRTAPASFSSRS